ncbi:MAG TPA: response regulator transcription factor [Actinomycetota bacterium]|nr:response regulator transcription factor [Actinomycetota bacterium]
MTSRIKVLIVDDHRVFAEALTLALGKESDIQVADPPALTGEDAVHAVQEFEPDVVLMDVGLPGIDGIEATRRIREARPGTAVVILTSEAGASRLPAAAAAGACGYLDKTVALDDLGAAVRAAFAGQILLPEASPAGAADAPALTAPFDMLTPREQEVLELLAEGLPNRDIARRLVLSVRTVDTHVHNLLIKLGVHSKLEAVVKAMRAGVIGRR